MLISYKWLQSYFDEKLPTPEKLGEALTFSGFELEGIEKKGDDFVLDIKVLPDRACYALSHRGIAREVSAALEVPLTKGGAESARRGLLSPLPKGATHSDVRGLFFPRSCDEKPIFELPIPDPSIGIDEPKLCTKFVARRIENIKVGPSPAWLREALEAIGQRSINNIVDITNFVMFDIGRPTHAFDADKVKGKLTVRRARKGEVVVTLDNKRVEFNNGELVMADDEGPVGLAGIKGGKRTEVDENTRDIILEAANWNPSYIRLTATATGIKTEASRRFENRISPLLGEEGIDAVTRLIAEVASTPDMKIGKRVALSFEKPVQRTLAVDPEEISKKLGITVDVKTVVHSLERLGISVTEEKSQRLSALIPYERLDLSIPEDIAEEVGRLVGYDKVPALIPSYESGSGGCEIPKTFYDEWKIREILTNAGFSEVMTSSFGEKGDVAIEKPLAEDKKFARPNLWSNFEKALRMNTLNAPLFGSDEVQIFEIGQVFPRGGEHTALALGYAGPKKKSSAIQDALALLTASGIEISGEEKNAVFEGLIPTRSDLVKKWDISIPIARAEKFAPFSLYPFIVRDVALFVPPDLKPEVVAKVIKENAGDLVVRGPELFDEFSKDGKKSLAFRLVFQSFERTLQDDEVNRQTEKVYTALKQKGWEVR